MTGLERLLFNHKGYKGLHRGAQRAIAHAFAFLHDVPRAPSWLNKKSEFSIKVKYSRKPVILLVIISCIFQFLHAGVITNNSQNLYPPPDSLPPAPPGQAEELSGPTLACVGDISQYSIDVPVACSCQWTINGVIQSETGSPLNVIWTQPGPKTVSVIFICAGGQTSGPASMAVSVFETPEQPQPILGEEYVCDYTFHTYSTFVDPWDSCEWTVNEVVQSGYGPSITYSFGGAGTYLFEVTAYNPCGTSTEQTLLVTAQGSAPPAPSPIQGPGAGCVGETGIYTTTVGAGESCLWWINGVLQSSTTTSLAVNWSDWGDKLIEVRALSDCGTGNPATKYVTVMYHPQVFLGNDTTIMQGQTIVLDAGNTGSEYLWSTGETTQTIAVNSTGAYSVNVTNPCGSDADTIDVSVYVGLNEFENNDECFRLECQDGRISFPGLDPKDVKIQIVNLSGIIFYEGPPKEVKLTGHGIWLIRFIGLETCCYRKLIIL
jgi:hypothetical protein